MKGEKKSVFSSKTERGKRETGREKSNGISQRPSPAGKKRKMHIFCTGSYSTIHG
jgi:hypothetical protein